MTTEAAQATTKPSTTEGGSAAQRERRRRILDATIALASQGGFDAVQMRAVADRAEVALGTLYRYFPSKVHLLVAALAGQFEHAEQTLAVRTIPGESSDERVMYVLRRNTGTLQRHPQLTEALTRSFLFADASVSSEIDRVGQALTSMIVRAIGDHPEQPTEDDVALARVIGDVWLASLIGWVTGRVSAEDVDSSMAMAVRLLLR